MRLQAAVLSVLVASQSLACAGLSSRGPAREGDTAQLRKALESDFRHGKLDRDSVKDLAQIMAEREARVAKGPQALQRVQQVRLCARELEDVLEQRAEQQDEAAAAAAMALLLVGLGEPAGRSVVPPRATRTKKCGLRPCAHRRRPRSATMCRRCWMQRDWIRTRWYA
ncbi:MAG: hypothetical protein MUF54_24030 [Polyangiaceae bacterium]|nr:hypothetical protein [Polyangiaceae bacterium]